MSVAVTGIEAAGNAAEAAEAVLVGSPVYRASFGHPLRGLLDHLPRGMWRECRAPLRGKAVCIVATGASHALAASTGLRRLEPQA